jgi:hypothetical protein
MGRHSQFFGQFASAENFDQLQGAIGQTSFAQCRFVNSSAVVELVQIFQIDWDIAGSERSVVETALGHTADEGHLTAFESDTNGATGTGCLAFATATAGFTVTAGFTLAEAFATVLGSRTRA